MSKRLKVNCPDGAESYDIYLTAGFEELPEELGKLGMTGRRLCIVTDSCVGELYAEKVRRELLRLFQTVAVYTFPKGEWNKNLDNVKDIYKFLIEEGFDRKDVILCLGGGVAGDMAGFTAATYLRGIRFIQIPTSLLAQTDSSIGGKTGVDLNKYKNMVGAFHNPSLVYMNMEVLDTLSGRDFSNGMAEIIKHGYIRDASYLDFLRSSGEAILNKDHDVLEEMIYRSCRIKAEVVELDPREEGLRAVLNFGHTLGHAIEKYMGFKLMHGECVCLGSLAAIYICVKRGLLSEGEFERSRELFSFFGLPVLLDSGAEEEEIVELTRSDKKKDGEHVKFVLLKRLGEAFTDSTVGEDEMLEALGRLKR